MKGRMVWVVALLVVGGAGVAAGAVHISTAADRRAVEQAVFDYVDALYQVDPSRIARSVHPQLVKLGFSRQADGSYRQAPMTYEQLHALAGRWNASGRVDASRARREVVVLDILDRTASAKLVAEWGIDYMQLGRFDGRWQIIHVLWQSHPPASPR